MSPCNYSKISGVEVKTEYISSFGPSLIYSEVSRIRPPSGLSVGGLNDESVLIVGAVYTYVDKSYLGPNKVA